MTLSPLEATKKLCERSGWALTNLELQKHLFLAQLDYMREYDGKLIGATFQAWDYGPVVPELYRTLCRFGARPIENIFHSVGVRKRAEDDLLYASYERYKQKTPGQLVALTHKLHGAWDRNYRPDVRHIIIPDEDIRKEARLGF